MEKKRIVITGMGMITPVGNTVEQSWKSIINGRSGIKRISSFDPSDYPSQVAGEIEDFDPEKLFNTQTARRYDRSMLYALYAAKQAILQAGLDSEDGLRDETGVLIGPGLGSMQLVEQGALTLNNRGPRRISPFFIPGTIINMSGGLVSIEYGFRGPNFSITSACTTGNHSIGEGYWMLQRGDAKVMVVGATEASVTPLTIAGFCAAKALSTLNEPPEKSSRPFDVSRNGFVIGEGSGVLVLEPLEQALARGARPLAEIVGYGLSADAFHITAPSKDGDGAYRSMRKALQHAEIEPNSIGYINAHATGTPLGDTVEIKAVAKLFKGEPPPTSSTKSAIGHLLGAAGAVEAIFTIQALRNQVLPPTLHLQKQDQDDPLDHVLEARTGSFEYALSNAFGFGGTNSTLIFKRYN